MKYIQFGRIICMNKAQTCNTVNTPIHIANNNIANSYVIALCISVDPQLCYRQSVSIFHPFGHF